MSVTLGLLGSVDGRELVAVQESCTARDYDRLRSGTVPETIERTAAAPKPEVPLLLSSTRSLSFDHQVDSALVWSPAGCQHRN